MLSDSWRNVVLEGVKSVGIASTTLVVVEVVEIVVVFLDMIIEV